MGTYKRIFLRISVALLLCLALVAVCISAIGEQDGFSSSYRGGIFYRRLRNVTLTGDPRTDIVNVAMSQVGYTEGNNASALSGLANGSKNYTEYGLWYKNNVDGSDAFDRSAWCACFVSWCAAQANISSDVVYYHAFTPYGYNWFSENAQTYTRAQVADGVYAPQPGDIVYFKSSANNRKVNHVGIVVRYTDGVLYAIEGNTGSGENTSDGGAVCLKSYDVSDTFIRYICCPDYAQ